MITDNLCTACGACASVCPLKCIEIKRDCNGFYNPEIDEDRCVKCNRCSKVCPANQRAKGKNWLDGEYYACWAKEKTQRFEGSSGGLFGLLAAETIKRNGIVFGAAFTKDFEAVYQTSTEHVSLSALKKSKYIESYTGTIFAEVKQKLDEGKDVLYCGTACQIDGLINYLGKSYENLLICDFLCQGVVSSGLYKRYIENLEKKYGEISFLSFRSKQYGWKAYCIYATFKSGKHYLKTKFQDPYLRMYFEHIGIRDACFECQRLKNSNADITLGDYWNASTNKKIKDTNEGISLVGIHTEKGKKAFEEIKSECEVFLLENKDCSYAFTRTIKRPVNREEELTKLSQIDNLFDSPVPLKVRIKGFLYWLRAAMQRMSLK